MLSTTANESKRYNGRIKEIWELEYGESYTVSLFYVGWAKSVQKEECGFITMSLGEPQHGAKGVKGVTAKYEPWLFTKDVAQCLNISDPIKSSRVIIRRGQRNIIGMDGVTCEEDFHQFGVTQQKNGYADEESDTSRRIRTTLPIPGRPYLRKSHSTGRNYSKKIKKTEIVAEKIVKWCLIVWITHPVGNPKWKVMM